MAVGTGKYFLNRPSAALVGVIFARSDERKKPRNVHKAVGTGKIGQEKVIANHGGKGKQTGNE